jgi:iron complex transport system substrate-binding protein
LDTLRLKAALSVLIIAAGMISLPFFVSSTSASEPQASGFLIDFGNWDVTWTKMDIKEGLNPFEALDIVCKANDFDYTIENGAIKDIKGVSSDETHKWELWTISKNSLTWMKESQPHNTDISRYTIAAWAYCGEDDTPTVAVDETGRSIYGYQQAQRVISLSPALTEIMGALRAVPTLVGTDRYSSHPNSVVTGHNDGKIKIVGDFLNPSFELIIGQRPDIVLCDGSLYAHHEMADRLRKTNVNAVLMYGGENIREIMSNIYIAGVAIGYDIRAAEVIDTLERAQKEVADTILECFDAKNVNVMMALSPEKSPWVTGSGTYVNDLSSAVLGNNVFAERDGWVHINSELVMTANPSVIIILTADYAATQDEYDMVIASLSAEWKATDAYKNGKIYLICDGAGEMSLNPSPRFAQLMEITARILHPDAFADMEMPKYIGNDYEEHLTITKYLGYNE